jgi:uncharacterized protein
MASFAQTNCKTMKQRIIGFDLARAYALFGMYIVNFNIVFGDYQDKSIIGRMLSLFSGNSSTVFVMLAGMGIALMSNRENEYSLEEKRRLKNIVTKRAWFLFVIGLLLYLWWPADILHFYGGYMHIAAFLLFLNKRYYIIASLLSIIVFHLLLLIIPYETGWSFETLTYRDFWTINGFLRNTLYNGWNSLFPWLAYFTTGMYLGRMDLTLKKTQLKMFIIGVSIFLLVSISQLLSNQFFLSEEVKFFINADYLPPFLPFILSTLGFGFMLISGFMFLGSYVSEKSFANDLAKTGQMTLTHYISHLTIGMLILASLSGKEYTAHITDQPPVTPICILLFSIVYFIVSYYFSKFWTRKFGNGPFETLMRKISG